MNAALSRRAALIGGFALVAVPVWARKANLIPQRASARVIVDNDFAGDPDGLLGLAHQLLSPKTRTVLISASFLDQKLTPPGPLRGGSASEGKALAAELASRLGVGKGVPVVAGHESGAGQGVSEAAKAIIAEAMRNDPLPLFFTCGGPLTNLAEALRIEPAIAARMTLIWIGGGGYPDGGWEYNLGTDAEAARHVIENSPIPIWQIPQPAYRQMQVSIAEMTADIRPISAFSRWLYERFNNPPDFLDLGGAWPMGDSPLVLLTAISSESSRYRDMPARRIAADLRYGDEIPGRTIRVFEAMDIRLTQADLLAKLKLHANPQ